jgi:hypothetical protein
MLSGAVDSLNSTVGIVALAAALVAVIAVIVAAVALVRLRRLRADQLRVLGEASDRDVVRHAADVERRVDGLQAGIDSLSRALFERLSEAEKRLDGSVSKTAVVRYDAFNETSGHQSSSVAMLDDRGDGVIFSAILQREQARVYVKPVEAGSSSFELSPEERQALEQARAGRPEAGA